VIRRSGLATLEAVEAVLLDMDGTLVDSDAAVERAWRSWAIERGINPAEAVAIAAGRPAAATVRDLLPNADDKDVAEAAAYQLALQYEDLGDVVAGAGVGELLSVLARLDLPWAVVTSADRQLANRRLAAAGVQHPNLLVTSEDVRVGKPDPEGYRLAAAMLGLDPRHCLVVEDSIAGVQAGKAAGAVVVALKGLAADIQIADLHELAELLLGAHGGVGHR
jgi:HAD superfamily hydrolase (TIGR01509 family)